jgi:ABC-type Zn uptake system ZnuABC Zn-binding protein ZnuA
MPPTMRPGLMGRALALVALMAIVLAACRGPTSDGSAAPTPDPDAIRVVATTTVFADLVAQVGGTRVSVHSLVPKGGEVHTFDPTPADIQRIATAQLVVRNGLGLDDWLDSLVNDAGTQAPSIALAEDLPGVTYLTGNGDTPNPHLWMDVAYASLYVGRIAQALASVDPPDAGLFAQRAAAYQQTLAALDGRIRGQIATIPAADRVVVSFHDAFPYYARAYGLTVVGTIIDAPGQDPSAGEIAALVDRIRASGAKAIFAEAQFNDALAQAIAGETGATVVTDLYDGSLGDAPADSYVGMMTWDTDRVVAAIGAG